jgi:PHP family Zn ribbon phosphoesterase
MFDKALEYLYKQLKDTRISLGHAERRPGVTDEELDNLRSKIDMLEYSAAAVLAYEEPKRGEWVDDGSVIRCSSCHNSPLYNYWGRIKLSDRCPNCGAKMKGGIEDA